jgi:hypothetical protein
MIIKPSEYKEVDLAVYAERGIFKSHRDFYIYDQTHTNAASYGFENKLFAGVVQVTKLLIKGMPNDDHTVYDRPVEDRSLFIKYIYIYNAFMNSDIEDIDERFQKAILRPIVGMVSAYTDTKQLIQDPLDYNPTPIDKQYGISIYNFENKSLMSIMCNPIIMQNGLSIGIDRFDIVNPKYNIAKQLYQTNSSDSTLIPDHFEGKDLIRLGETDIYQHESYYKNNNSFTEESLLNLSKQYNKGRFKFGREESGLAVYNNEMSLKISDLIDKRRMLQSFVIDITKASAFSMFEGFTIMYETGKGQGIKMVKPPFGQYVIDYMNKKMDYVYNEFTRLSEMISEKFGRVRILLNVNNIEHVVKCIFLDNRFQEDNKVVTVRMTKLECVNNYILESMYGRGNRGLIDDFKEEHDMDLLNYYSFNQDGNQYLFNGRL